ncbi:MAG: hypothetical protein U0452_05450 [Anaerolineae bacterium]
MSASRALVTGAGGGFVGRHIVAPPAGREGRNGAGPSLDEGLQDDWHAFGDALTLRVSGPDDLPTLDADAVVHAAALDRRCNRPELYA